MATALSTPPDAPAPPAPAVDVPTFPIYRFSIKQYEAMIASGILTARDRVELIDGWVVPKMAKNPPHVIATGQLYDALAPLVPAGHYLAKEDPLVVGTSMPEPDIAVVRGRRRDYTAGPPAAEHASLIVEVADASLRRDQLEKAVAYATAKVPVYWIVNLVNLVVEVYNDPTGPAESPTYARREVFEASAEVPVILDGREVGRISVRDILP
jgi:Uma2 family endonuclease